LNLHKETPENILVTRLSALGDVVNIFPLLPLIKEQFPDATLTVLTGSLTAGLLEGDSLVDEVLVHNKTKNPMKLAPFLFRLWHSKFDLVIDFQSSRYTRWLAWATGAKSRLGHGKPPFYSRALTIEISTKHACEIFCEIMDSLNIQKSQLTPRFPNLDAAKGNAAKLLPPFLSGKDFVVFNPGHSPAWKTKRWPLKYWIEIGKKIQSHGVGIVVSGGSSESRIAEEIVSGIGGNVFPMAGATNLQELAGIMGLAKGVLSTDSGPMHVAAMAGAKVAALFGPTNPVTSGPLGKHHVILHRQLHCSCCFKKNCPYEHECLDQLKPDDVWEKIGVWFDS
jgi:lipopolysaccharide heptosyltransferase II